VLKKAKDKVRTKLKPILDAAGVGATDDLITAKFTADHTKMDAALDSLDITFDPTTKKATIKNKFNTSVKITDDVTNSADTAPIPLTTTQIADVKNKMKDMGPLNTLFKTFSDLFATSKPTSAQMDSAWLLVATDFLEDGLNKAQTKADWSAGDHGPPVGMKMSVSVIRDMTSAELPGTTYSKGLQVNINFIAPGESGTFPTFVVFDQPNNKWLWFGNQQWVGVDIRANAHMQIDSAGTVTLKTGWELHIDDMQNFALSSKGVKSAIVTGPGMPSGGVIMDRNAPKDYFSIPSSSSESQYWVSDDQILGAVTENSEYTVGLYAEAATGVSAVSLSNTPLQTIKVKVPSKPLLNADLKNALFWTLTAPASHTLLTEVSIPGSFKVSWTNPTTGTAKVVGAQLGWQETGLSDKQVEKKVSAAGQTSITIDTSSFASAVPSFAWLWMWGENADGLRFSTNWQFQ
jgi:hypothetical protein